MKTLKIMIFCIVFLSVSGIASAGQETGMYLGGSLGYTSLDITQATVAFDDNDKGFKIFGGYNFGLVPFIDLAVEGSYVDFGEAATASIPLDVGVTAWDIFGVACLNMGPIGVFGKVGQAWWDSEATTLSTILDHSSNDMAYGIGVRFQIGSAAVRAEYEYFDMEIADINFFSVGVSWTF